MPYIGNSIRAADDYRLIDDISSSFNGSTTSFALQVAGSAPVPFPKSPQQVLISVNGVIQEPDPTGSSGFNLVGTNIVFSSAPTNGHAFFGIIYATADYLNAGGNFPAGSLGAPSITFIGDENTGLYRKSAGSIGFVADATEIANTDSNGLTISSGNLIIPDSIIHNGDSDTKIRFGSANEFSVETAGVERFEITPTEVTFNDTGVDTDFRIEGDSVANLFKVDASVDNIGIGMASPTFSSGNGIELADNFFLGFGSGNGTRPDFQFGTTVGATLDIRCGTGADTADLVIDTNGRLGIGITSPGENLHIKDTSSNPGIRLTSDADGITELQFGDTADGVRGNIIYRNGSAGDALCFHGYNNSERMRIDSSGRVLIGITSARTYEQPEPFSGNDTVPALQLEGAGASGGTHRVFGHTYNNNDVYAPTHIFAKTRGSSTGAVTIVNSGDPLGIISFQGADGVDLEEAAQIRAEVDGTPGSNDMPGRLLFSTTADGGHAPSTRMTIDSSGNVGIGTTSPSTTLHLDSTGTPTTIKIDSDTESSIDFNDHGGSAIRYKIGTNISSNDGQFEIRDATNSAERMRITSAGNVGIGTSSPGEKLHINSATTFAGLKVSTTNNTTRAMIELNGKDSSGNEVELRLGGFGDTNRGEIFTVTNHSIGFATNNAAPQMILDTSGKVGIGNTSPTNTFDGAGLKIETYQQRNDSYASPDGYYGASLGEVTNSATKVWATVESHYAQASAVSAGLFLKAFHQDAGGSQCGFTIKNLKTDNPLTFNSVATAASTGSPAVETERMRITSAGDLLVGNYLGGGTNQPRVFFLSEGGNFPDQNNRLGLRISNGYSDASIRAYGNSSNWNHVKFYSTHLSGGSITTAGSITMSGGNTIAYNTSSDYRLKENEVLISDGITRLKQLKPYRFNWKTDTSKKVDGFYAHEVSGIVPEAISGEKDAVVTQAMIDAGEIDEAIGTPVYQGIDQAKLVPLLTAALQEEITKREALETRIAALEAA